MTSSINGKVYLIGAGPGDPGLLTIKARDCIALADVVIYDYLANPVFLNYANKKAEIIYVGKKGGCHTMPQEEINQLIMDKARQGQIVARLKGGDPFIFGRGGEEGMELFEAGIPFEVIPGITSAIAVPAYAGIPLTHRDFTASVTFITGHEDPAKEKSNIAWDKLGSDTGTLVFLMGVGNLPKIVENLIKHGRSPETPVAVIHRGTVPAQKTVTGTLKNISRVVEEQGIKPPSIIVVGHVVTLRDGLNWFEKNPLFGKRIVVTRAREQASSFLATLSALGAECIEFPTIEIVPPKTWDKLDSAINNITDYQWVIFTSVNGVKYFFERMHVLGKDARALNNIKIGAIGPVTAQTVRENGIQPDLVPDEYKAEAVVDKFEGQITDSLKILLPRAAKARELLPKELEKMGATVDVVETYSTEIPDHNRDIIRDMLENNDIDLVTFTSSSTVTNFVKMFESDKKQFLDWMTRVNIGCIGPITAKTAEENDLKTSIMPEDYTIEALANAIVQYFSSHHL